MNLKKKKLINIDELVGLTILKVHDLYGDYLVLEFEDAFMAISGYDEDGGSGSFNEKAELSLGDLVDIGLISKEEYHQELRAKEEKQRLQREQQEKNEYERLKKKFEKENEDKNEKLT